MGDVDLTKALGKQDVDVLLEQLIPAVAEYLLDLDVGVHDPPVAIDDQYPFTRGLQERPGPRLALPQFRLHPAVSADGRAEDEGGHRHHAHEELQQEEALRGCMARERTDLPRRVPGRDRECEKGRGRGFALAEAHRRPDREGEDGEGQ